VALEPYRKATYRQTFLTQHSLSDSAYDAVSEHSGHASIYLRAGRIMDSLAVATDEDRAQSEVPWWGEVEHWPPRISRDELFAAFKALPDAVAGDPVSYGALAGAVAEGGANGGLEDFSEALVDLIEAGYVDALSNEHGVKANYILTDKACDELGHA
jgi:hypothetical protein